VRPWWGSAILGSPLARRLDRPSQRLAVYGSLAPGEAHHHLLGDCPGTWVRAAVRGAYDPNGWGRTGGWPGLWPDPREPQRPVWLLESPALERHWSRLDAFEGPEYVRLLVRVELAGGGARVANLYAVPRPRGRASRAPAHG